MPTVELVCHTLHGENVKLIVIKKSVIFCCVDQHFKAQPRV